jgi:glycosyltransferase involved in cell wall biosynthesis
MPTDCQTEAPRLSLVIPCYNESANLPRLVERCAEAFAGEDVEVVFVENGSTDNSREVLARMLPDHSYARRVDVDVNQGYGFGILSGLRAASAPYLGWTHADLQADPGDALKALDVIRAAGDGVVFIKGSRYGRALGAVAFTWGMAAFESIVLGARMWDINAQPNIFPRSFFESWEDPPNDFSLDLYAYYKAVHRGLPIRRLSVYFGPREHGVGHNDTLAAKLRLARRTMAYSVGLRRRLRSGN